MNARIKTIYFDNALGLYMIGYCKTYGLDPKEAIKHSIVMATAEYYWKVMLKEQTVEREVEE